MPLGSKAKYTAAQKRKASRIEQSYEDKGVPKSEAEARAWATVNKQSGGGEKAGGSGQRKAPAKKAQDRHDSAKRAAASREGHPRNSRVSLSTQTKESLLKKARAKDIRGRSSMRKDQLIEALKKAS
ncbi:Rho termination factor N-terminal domain-containing protein [Pseudomonas rhodesiae]|uniref:Rho termination factor N-terminal domain-containing protein n=1 Tax=Pseudomonas rhodesiae TaxID=76760 RepID=UPI0028A9C91A|nr:Rho termination factor N-terminal domain-containing protein [Pseudomonas rhodesiae]